MDKKKIIILALALAVILGGAYILYDKLGSRVSAEQIAAEGTPANTEQVSLENSGSSDPEHCSAAHFFSPLLSFQTNLIEVPSKSKASLILFSRYLAYEKCMSSLSLILKENRGGFVPICVI